MLRKMHKRIFFSGKSEPYMSCQGSLEKH